MSVILLLSAAITLVQCVHLLVWSSLKVLSFLIISSVKFALKCTCCCCWVLWSKLRNIHKGFHLFKNTLLTFLLKKKKQLKIRSSPHFTLHVKQMEPSLLLCVYLVGFDSRLDSSFLLSVALVKSIVQVAVYSRGPAKRMLYLYNCVPGITYILQ